jgi:hypothetical protein
VSTIHQYYLSQLKYYYGSHIIVKPLWYWQTPIERLRRVIDRISKKKMLRISDLYKFRHKYHFSTWRAIENDMLGGVYINGRRRPIGWLSNSDGSIKIEVKEANPDEYCYWCNAPIHLKKEDKGKYYLFQNVCKDRLCREMYAVLHGKHTEIKVIRNVEHGETFKNSFMVEFFVRKVKILQKKLRKQTLNRGTK